MNLLKLLFKVSKNLKPIQLTNFREPLTIYNPLNPLATFPNGLEIHTSKREKYVLDNRGYLHAQTWGVISPDNDEDRDTEEECKYEFKDLLLDSLVDGRVLSIGTLPHEKAQRVDEYIAESIRADSGRIRHYHDEVKKIMQQFAQNPTINPYVSAQCFPLIILYEERAAIENERIGIHLTERNWRSINPTP